MVSRVTASETGWDSARDEAIAALREARGWRLPALDWRPVGDAVEGMRAAAAGRDLTALWAMTGRLGSCGPRRVHTRLGDPAPELPAPRPVLERIAELVSTLAGADDGSAGCDDQGGSGGSGAASDFPSGAGRPGSRADGRPPAAAPGG
jgi:hypothetical protein